MVSNPTGKGMRARVTMKSFLYQLQLGNLKISYHIIMPLTTVVFVTTEGSVWPPVVPVPGYRYKSISYNSASPT